MGREKGQSIVELAIIAPLLIFFLMGTLEIGVAIRNYLALVNANREAVRFAVRPGYLQLAEDEYEDSYERVWEHALDVLDPWGAGVKKDSVFAYLDEATGEVKTGVTEQDEEFPGILNFNRESSGMVINSIIVEPGVVEMNADNTPKCKVSPCTCEDAELLYAEGFTTTHSIPQLSWATGIFTDTRRDIEAEAQKLQRNHIVESCRTLRSGGVVLKNHVVIGEMTAEVDMMFGFPLVSNPMTDPYQLYTHTTMRLLDTRHNIEDLIKQ